MPPSDCLRQDCRFARCVGAFGFPSEPCPRKSIRPSRRQEWWLRPRQLWICRQYWNELEPELDAWHQGRRSLAKRSRSSVQRQDRRRGKEKEAGRLTPKTLKRMSFEERGQAAEYGRVHRRFAVRSGITLDTDYRALLFCERTQVISNVLPADDTALSSRIRKDIRRLVIIWFTRHVWAVCRINLVGCSVV